MEEQARAVSLILNYLQLRGIRRRKLGHQTIGIDDEALFIDAMTWLIDEGIIHCETRRGLGQFNGCCLSSRGLALIGTHIDFDGENMRFSEAIERVQSGRASVSAIGDFLGAFSGGILKSLGS